MCTKLKNIQFYSVKVTFLLIYFEDKYPGRNYILLNSWCHCNSSFPCHGPQTVYFGYEKKMSCFIGFFKKSIFFLVCSNFLNLDLYPHEVRHPVEVAPEGSVTFYFIYRSLKMSKICLKK